MKPWTQEQNDRFMELHNQKMSASLIAEAMGLSRSAILGKRWRLGLAKSVKPRIMKKQAYRNQATVLRPKLRSDGALPAPPAPMPPPSDAARRSFATDCGPAYGLFDLPPASCKWPIGNPDEKHFCYCAAP